MKLTVLALITQDVGGASADGLISSVDGAVSSILAVTVAGTEIAVRTRETWTTATSRRT